MKEGWEYKKLGEVCDLYQPKTISAKEMVSDGLFDVFGANGKIGKYHRYNTGTAAEPYGSDPVPGLYGSREVSDCEASSAAQSQEGNRDHGGCAGGEGRRDPRCHR